MEIEFSKQSLAKISKHSVSVFPLEGYGFLIGTQEIIYAAIPTGKTTKWGNATDRFSELETAYPKAEVLAEEVGWFVRGIYHSHSGDWIKESPLLFVPPLFQNKIIYIKRVDGGDLILASDAYQKNQSQEWENCEIKSKVYEPLSAETNPKRILSKWIKIWKPVDYYNNHEKELTRIFE